MAILRRVHHQLLKGKNFFFLWKKTRSFSYVTTHDTHFPSTPSLCSISSLSWFHHLNLSNVDIRSLKSIHVHLFVHGISGDRFTATKLLSLYGSFGLVDVARKVFDEITEPDVFSLKVMTRLYFLNGWYRELVDFHEANSTRRCEGDDNNVLFSMLLKACSELKELNPGRKLHCWIVKAGNPDGYVISGLVDMYSKCGEIESAREVFEQDDVVNRSVVRWTSMISGYVQNDRAEDAVILFNRMRYFLQANKFTLGSLLTACTKLAALHQGKWIHGYIIKNSIKSNPYLETSLVDMYIKCGSLIDARSAFNELSSVVPDLVSWTAMIVGYAQGGFPAEAVHLFVDKKWESIKPNGITISSVLSSCAQISWLSLGKSAHCVGVKLGLLDANVVNALIDMYAKNNENLDSFRVFQTMSNTNDVVAWNSIVSGYSQNGSAHESLALFQEMRTKSSVLPDAITLVSAFSAFGTLGALLAGSSLYSYSIKVGFFPASVYLGTAILTFYAKCGDALSSRGVFDEMEEKNIATWSAMIGGYGSQGDSVASLALFNTMLSVNSLQPNEAVFTSILSTCSHTGMVGEGWKIFNSMCKTFNFVPSVKHYACMVDLLARDGRLEEALEFLEQLPVVHQQDVSLLGSFLHGCGLHSRFDLAEVVIKRIFMECGDLVESCYYVLVCNLYASDGRWGDVEVVREVMKQRGLTKFPGRSLSGHEC